MPVTNNRPPSYIRAGQLEGAHSAAWENALTAGTVRQDGWCALDAAEIVVVGTLHLQHES